MGRIVFTGGRVFDGTGAPSAEADLAIEDDRIVDVGVRLEGDEQVDASGATLLPGLFDCHVHVMFSHLDYLKQMDTPFSYMFFDAARNLEATLAAGITTVRDAGGADLGVKRAVEDGLVNGPRMEISLTMLSQTGGHGDPWLVCGGAYPAFPPYPGMPSPIVDGPEEMRRKVRELIRDGADVIKIATSGGVYSPTDDPRHAHFRMDELETVVAEADAAGRWVMAHAHGTAGIEQAIRAGTRSIEHGTLLDEATVGLMVERGTYLVPTLQSSKGSREAVAAGASIPEEMVRKDEELIEAQFASFRLAVEAGVKIAMGTDTGITPHGRNLEELELMVEHGMTSEQAWVATSKAAAELMGLDRELGTLEPGKRADVVLLDGDETDVTGLRDRVRAVYKEGRRVVARSPAARG